ncbi:methionine adenosyltransferase [uncultured Alistipes sp.]|uniref:methionine adenosyltransferase n=1 Tax=uncultured Alistipes sp. TaxID=538949 RepID=UPI00261FD8BB|nr:methionine adenosyltransferase [uncultured Alistipes sp.]
MGKFLFTSESVSEGHPDKVSDQISDAILDEFLRHDANSKVACETLCTTGLVVVAGEVRSEAYVDVQGVARRVIDRIGYNKSAYQFDAASCGILSAIHEQSSDINQGVVREEEDAQGAGDQGIMFGYACNETREYMPATLILSHVILKELAVIRREGEVMTYLRPDSKSQVTVEYDDATGCPLRVHTIVVSTQHDEFVAAGEGVTEKQAERQMQERIREDVRTILIPRVKARLERAGDKLAGLIGDDYILHVNPTGKFVIGGPHGDTGLTGRKIIVDTYGGRGAHGGGAFSGKDSSKVDRSAAYAARHIAKNMVAAGIADQVLVELSYAIGIAEPLSIYVDTYGSKRPAGLEGMTDGEIASHIGKLFDLRPAAIVRRFGLKNPIFEATASYGHFGNRPYTCVEKLWEHGKEVEREIEYFGWEKLDAVDLLKKEFGL